MVPKVFPPALLVPQTDPVAALDQVAAKSPGAARSGLAIAIGDVLEFMNDWPPNQVAKCDSELSQDGLPTLTEVRARFSKVVQRVVRRGQIKNDDEFYALRAVVEQHGVSAETIWPLLEAYEVSPVSGSPTA